MPVKIAGYNIDADLLNRFKQLLISLAEVESEEGELSAELRAFLYEDNLTPETLSAAYARISRYPESVGELRKIAAQSVARARRSNRTIVFEYGHASVAEHAVFNIDITGVSRLAVETIESRRLMSYTEKSQRYISMTRDYIIPSEIALSALKNKFSAYCDRAFEEYQIYSQQLKYFYEGKEGGEENYNVKEDARYLLPLSCSAQLGMTANIRNIEHLLRRTMTHPLAELRAFSDELKGEVMRIAPSLVRHLEQENLDLDYHPLKFTGVAPEENVKLLSVPENADDITLTALMFASEGIPWEEADRRIAEMNAEGKRAYIKDKLKGLRAYHALPRAFEAVDFSFQLVLSATAYAQLKRHRIATQLITPYSLEFGYSIPASIEEAGMGDDFREKMRDAERLYDEIFERYPFCAPYALTNAHRKIVYFKANAREMTHLARLRMGEDAQWDIRGIVAEMINLARKQAPLTLALACGKDNFDDIMSSF